MIDTGDVRKGITLDIDGKLVKVIDFSHNKQGRGSAQLRMTLRDLRTGALTQQTVMAGAKFQSVRLERQHVQFLYAEGDHFHFMDTETFDQIMLDRSAVAEAEKFLKENDVIDLLTYNGEPIDVELPTAVVLAVTQTDPGFVQQLEQRRHDACRRQRAAGLAARALPFASLQRQAQPLGRAVERQQARIAHARIRHRPTTLRFIEARSLAVP